MLHTGRGPLPDTSASGVVPMKPRMASSKSCRSPNGSVFVNAAFAFNVARSGLNGVITPIATALFVFDMSFSRSGIYYIEIGQRHRADALAGRGEEDEKHNGRSD